MRIQKVANSIDDVIQNIKEGTPHGYMTRVDEKGKPFYTLANYGAKIGTQLVMTRKGEYEGLGLIVLENVKGLLSSEKIIEALQFLKDENYIGAMKKLFIEEEIQKQGINLIYWVIKIWLNHLQFQIPPEIDKIKTDEFRENNQDLVKWITRELQTPIDAKVKIFQVGKSKKGHSVVPDDWIDKEFDNCDDLHEEINQLDWRKGKPKVTYCATYSLSVVKANTWNNLENVQYTNLKEIKIFAYIFKNNGKFQSIVKEVENLQKLKEYIEKFVKKDYYENKNKIEYIIQKNRNDASDSIIIIVDKKQFFNYEEIYIKPKISIGVLSSRIQKCIRRGRKCPQTLIDTLKYLHLAPGYNLPDLQFVRVSASRQLLWRAFISCIEDSFVFFNDSCGLKEIIILSIITQIDPSLQISNEILEIITNLLLQLQYHDDKIFDWREGIPDQVKHLKINNNLIINEQNQYEQQEILEQIANGFKVAIRFQPMMGGDQKMLKSYLYLFNMISKQIVKGQKNFETFEKYNIIQINHGIKQNNEFLNNSDESIEEITKYVSYDHHCVPNIIIKLQGSLNFLGDQDFTTKKISSFIWEKSSKMNVRINKNINKYQYEGLNWKQKNTLETLVTIQKYYLKCEKIKLQNLNQNQINNIFKSEEQEQEIEQDLVEINQESEEENIESENKDSFAVENAQIQFENNQINQENTNNNNENQSENIQNVGRHAFLIIFGQKFRVNYQKQNFEAIICGNIDQIVKIKKISSGNQMEYVDGKLRFQCETLFVNQFERQKVQLYQPPEGYNWIFQDKTVDIELQLVSNDAENLKNKIKFFVNGIETQAFNASNLLIPISKQLKQIPQQNYIQLIKSVFLVKNIQNQEIQFENILKLKQIAKLRLEKKDFRLFKWEDFVKNTVFNNSIFWKHVLVKLFSNNDTEIVIGPVDRMGQKLQNSISYLYEGIIWKIYNFLCLIYPRVIKVQGDMKFKVERNTVEYQQMLEILKQLSIDGIQEIQQKSDIFKQTIQKVQIITQLWEHQQETVNKIVHGFTKQKKLGFGDASCVGSGKTLTALSVISKLHEFNIENNQKFFTGFLVLIPYKQLFDTWITEIKKHTNKNKSFQLFTQNADGSMEPPNQQLKFELHSIVLTTLARIREHPIYNSWQLVVIDECLAVQRREALQTEEAWRQVMCSQYGVIMMSATFFRSRFDQLFYMLKMLRTGMPHQKEYLDSILNESMICFINENQRKWLQSIHKFELNSDLRQQYDQILNQFISNNDNQKTYSNLHEFLYKNYSPIKDLQILIKSLQNQGCKLLIYSRSKNEAEEISLKIENVSRYPDKSKTHVVLSYQEGTFGLNDLVIYNTILTRPPEPDKLPQMKGRLDRPGQIKEELRLEFFLIKDSIEEALLIRLEIAKMFLNNYIMPLAKFYELAIKR